MFVETTIKVIHSLCPEDCHGEICWKPTNVSNFDRMKVVTAFCPDKKHEAKRICDFSRGWKRSNTTECTSPPVKDLLDQMEINNVSSSEVGIKIANETKNTMEYSGNIRTYSIILEHLSQQLGDVSDNNITSFAVLDTANNLLDESKEADWEQFSVKKKMTIVSKILTSVENTVVSLVNETDGDLSLIQKDNFALEAKLIRADEKVLKDFKYIPPPILNNNTKEASDANQKSITIPKDTLDTITSSKENLTLIFTEYNDIEKLLQPIQSDNVERILNSKIISASLLKANKRVSGPFEGFIYYTKQLMEFINAHSGIFH
ncbi:DgyrCDS5516 [Dimorphilus gyrociliatus]|uniref:DgyrCDS5516 n=1 Tax=Dimorphilus gyrociliatus TaxID=2664684 RepID=A0A7I8VK48_9ANNE|nr:DgyrCDS5516 [Dimorphilus gyrociliatus]